MKIIKGFKEIWKKMNWYNRMRLLEANCRLRKKAKEHKGVLWMVSNIWRIISSVFAKLGRFIKFRSFF